ncbi:MAG: hypothetical protein RBR65_02445, partial [Aliarcobacter sp.]|nr:hypothetical protein [Aliarcobacter sp.]
MANSIDLLKQTKTIITDSSSVNSENQIVKDKPSFFDSLLTSNKTIKTIEREETASKSKIDVNIKDIEIEEKVEVSLDGEVK